jgi:Cd2+/Zn2+-exporting ATPase
MEDSPGLEAVKVDRAAGALAIAAIGRPPGDAVVDKLRQQLQSAGQDAATPCSLLTGAETCAACPHAGQLPPADRFTVEHQPGSTLIARVTCPTAPRFWRWKQGPLPVFVPREVRLPEDEHAENEWKAQLAGALVCGLAGILGWILGDATGAAWAFALAYLAGGWFPAVEVWERLRQRQLDVHFLMIAVALGAAAIGALEEGAVLLFLFSLSGALEHYAMGRTHREIRSLIRSAPKESTVLGPDGSERRIAVDQLTPGMRLLVKPGELFPVDAEIARGSTAADESNLTGEAIPVEKGVGDRVLGGTLNLWGAIEATALRPARDSALQRIIQLIHDAQHLKAPSQRFTDRFGTGYTLAILALTLGLFLTWWLAAGHPAFVSTAPGPRSAFYLAMTFLVVSSPCALVLSIPSAILAAIARAARSGILFRGGAAVEKLAEIDVVAMDKTGTLTTGELRVETIASFPPGQESEVARLACGMERLSDHPLARAIVRHGKQHAVIPAEAQATASITGQGMRATIDGQPAALGRREFVLESGIPTSAPANLPAPEAGVTEVWVAHRGVVGRVLLRDDIRPQAREVVAALRAAGLHTLALTGDRRATGEHLKLQVDLDEVRAELKPEEKVAAIAALSAQGRRVAMIGDGVNDAPALAAAHVGVAMGARGSDAALEQADIVLMHDRLENFLAAHQLSHRARRIIRQNLVLSLGTVVVLAGLAAFGRVPLTLGVLGHEGSTVLVVLNSLRLLLARRGR